MLQSFLLTFLVILLPILGLIPFLETNSRGAHSSPDRLMPKLQQKNTATPYWNHGANLKEGAHEVGRTAGSYLPLQHYHSTPPSIHSRPHLQAQPENHHPHKTLLQSLVCNASEDDSFNLPEPSSAHPVWGPSKRFVRGRWFSTKDDFRLTDSTLPPCLSPSVLLTLYESIRPSTIA